MTRRKYSTHGATLKPKGRQSTVLGEKTYTRYEGGGFVISYEAQPATLKKRERLTVTVQIEGHSKKSWSCLGVSPSVEVARIHASSAFRTHFKLTTGDPGDFEGTSLARVLDRCDCIPE